MASTQSFIPIKTIQNDAIILKDGSLRAVVIVSGLNFALLSEDEQNALINRYQEFLNSLDFFVQIVIQSRKLNIKNYLWLLEAKKPEQSNELMQIQLQEYITFVKTLTETTNIMVKNFYIIVPFAPIETRNESTIAKLKNAFFLNVKQKEEEESFLQKRNQLLQRAEFVQQTLRNTGARSALLQTQELIELFYNLYNPGLAEKGELEDITSLNIQ